MILGRSILAVLLLGEIHTFLQFDGSLRPGHEDWGYPLHIVLAVVLDMDLDPNLFSIGQSFNNHILASYHTLERASPGMSLPAVKGREGCLIVGKPRESDNLNEHWGYKMFHNATGVPIITPSTAHLSLVPVSSTGHTMEPRRTVGLSRDMLAQVSSSALPTAE